MDVPSSLDDARAAAAALGAAASTPVERVPLVEAVGRTAADEVRAAASLPRFASSAMDGWAVRSADVGAASPERPVVLPVAGEAAAGHPAGAAVPAGRAMRISTGARLPDGADAVVRVEETAPVEGGVEVRATAAPGRDVRLPGEDVADGDLVLRAGDVLGPGHVALLAGLGTTTVAVRRRPRAIVVITGDEVVASGAAPDPAPLGEGLIHDVGGPALAALLVASGIEAAEVRHVGDDLAATTAALADAAADLVVTCGGMSVGEHDHVRAALRALGAEAHVTGVALQPGRPTWLAGLSTGEGVRPVLALPGNPGAALTVATLLLAPLTAAMAGRPAPRRVEARLADDVRGDARRVRALRVALAEDDEGRRVARVLSGQQPHRLRSLPATDAYALIPAADGTLPAGTRVEVVPLPGAPDRRA